MLVTTSRTRWAVGAAALASASALAVTLAGCSSSSTPAPAPETTAASTPTSASTPSSSSASSGGSAVPTSAAFGSCDTLLPAAVLTSVSAGLAPDAGYAPLPGSYAEQIVSIGGIACGWSDTSGNTLTLAVADGPSDAITTAETALGGGSGTKTTAFGADVPAYTVNGGGTFPGDFEVFPTSGFWISTVSSLYPGPDAPAAKTVLASVLQALPSG